MRNATPVAGTEEIGLKDIIEFATSNLKLIALTTIAAVMVSVGYVVLAPKMYEGSLLLQMAKHGDAVIEAPARLAERLRYPTSYDEVVIQACGFESLGAVGDYLGGQLITSELKSIPNVLQLTVRGSSGEAVKQCSEALSTMIAKQQHELTEDRLSVSKASLAMLQQFEAAQIKQLEQAQKNGMGNYGYLVIMDKIAALRARIESLQGQLLPAIMHSTKVLVPLNMVKYPVAPKKKLSLATGLLVGLFLGVMLALILAAVRKFKGKTE